MAEDPHDDASDRMAENNNIAPQNNNSIPGRVSNAASSLTSPSANSLLALSSLTSQSATLPQMRQPQAQTSASTSSSRGSLSLDVVSLLQVQEAISGHHPIRSELSGQHIPTATIQEHATQPAAARTLQPLPRNMASEGLISHDAAQAPTISLSLQASLPHLASVQPGLGFSFPASHISPPTNQVQSLLHLLGAPPASRLAATNAPCPQHDQSQLLQQLLQEIRIRIQAIAMILSQQQQASGNDNSLRLSAVSDETTNEIIAMIWQQHQEGGHNPSDSDALNQIASMLFPTSLRHQQNQAFGRDAVTSTSTRSNELELLLQSMASANYSNSAALNQRPSDASADLISQLLLSQHVGAQSAASHLPTVRRTNQIAQLLSQLAQVQNNMDTHPLRDAVSNRSDVDSMHLQIDQLLSQQIMASAQQMGVLPTRVATQMESNANEFASNNAADVNTTCQGADRPALAAEGELQASTPHLPPPVNQAPPSFTQPPGDELAHQSSTGVSAASHQSVQSHQEDESDMNPTQLSEARWMARYKELKEFQQKHGHCRVPHGYTDNPQLSWWVMNQRAQFQLIRQGKKSWLSKDRVGLLKKIGFDWRSPITGNPKDKKRKREG